MAINANNVRLGFMQHSPLFSHPLQEVCFAIGDRASDSDVDLSAISQFVDSHEFGSIFLAPFERRTASF
jgi:hypothetical protein